ncbi:MAG: VanZ family protein [Chitinophagaceae bacterium]
MLLKAVFRTAGLFYVSLLFYIFFMARRRPRPSLHSHNHPHNLIPLKNKIADIHAYQSLTQAERWNFNTDLFGNIILFIPLPFFLLLFFGTRRAGKLILVGLAISLSVEISQFVLGIGVADIDDVILNTLGTCIGAVFVRLLLHLEWVKYK